MWNMKNIHKMKLLCPKCDLQMKYLGKRQFECECRFKIEFDKEIEWATVLKDVKPYFEPIDLPLHSGV